MSRVGGKTLRTMWSPMVDAFWAALNAQEAYRNLSLVEFRLHDGNRFAPQDEDQVLASDLPAHYCRQIQMPAPISDTQPSGRNTIRTLLEMGLWFPNVGGVLDSSLDAQHAFATIFDVIVSRRGQPGGLDGSGAVTGWTFSSDDVIDPVPSSSDPRRISFWASQYRVELTKARLSIV